MAEEVKLREPKDLTYEELLRIVENIRDIMWPEDNPDEDWDSDTMGWVGNELTCCGLHRVAKEEQEEDGNKP